MPATSSANHFLHEQHRASVAAPHFMALALRAAERTISREALHSTYSYGWQDLLGLNQKEMHCRRPPDVNRPVP